MKALKLIPLLLLSSCQQADASVKLSVHKKENYLNLSVDSDKPICLVTYKIYYKRFGVFAVYAQRLGIDIKGECEVNVPVGKSNEKLYIGDNGFSRDASGKRLCANITYHNLNENSLIYKDVCE